MHIYALLRYVLDLPPLPPPFFLVLLVWYDLVWQDNQGCALCNVSVGNDPASKNKICIPYETFDMHMYTDRFFFLSKLSFSPLQFPSFIDWVIRWERDQRCTVPLIKQALLSWYVQTKSSPCVLINPSRIFIHLIPKKRQQRKL